MSGTLVSISRFPIKGLTEDRLDAVRMSAGTGIPHDRKYALALVDTVFDEAHPAPLPKTRFAVLARYEKVARLRTRYREADRLIEIGVDGVPLVSGSLDEADGRRRIAEAVTGFMGETLDGPLRLVGAREHRFTDSSVRSPVFMEAVSIINLASVRDLERRIGKRVDFRRFRANFLIDGIPPWAEFDWLERQFSIGGIGLRGLIRIKRCPATEVDPDTALRDIRVPLELKDHFGHSELGIYASVLSDGVLRPGAVVAGPAA
jgi:uncharacterized protein YcbX